MWEWLINNHPVNTTISSLLQLMGTKRLGWLYPLNETAGLSMNWHVISSSLAYTHVPPLYSWINLSKSFLFFSRNPPSNCSKKWDASYFQWWPCGRVSPWVGGTVLLQWTHPKTREYLLSPQHVILLVEHCWKEGDFPAPGSRTWIIYRFMLSALILQPTLIVDWPIRQTASHLLIWAGQMSFDGTPSSFPRLRTEAPSFSVRERFAAGVNPEAISEIGTKWQW